MSKRVTIVMDDNLVKKLLQLQSQIIKRRAKIPSKTKRKLVSFSYVVNITLKKGLK